VAAAGIPEQRLRTFVEVFTSTANASEAARAAGYRGSAKVVSESARKLLKRADVQAMIAQVNAVATAARAASREERQLFWTRVMTGEPIDVDIIIPETGAVRKAKARPPLAARLKASELLGKSEGDFIKRVDVQHSGRVIVNVELPDNGRGVTEPSESDSADVE
jgi:phage terminase small subunit